MSTAPGRLNWPFAAAWAACTFVGWLLAVALATAGPSAWAYLLPGILAQMVTLSLRWRLICVSTEPRGASLRFTPVPAGQSAPSPTAPPPAAPQAHWQAAAAAKDHELTWVLCWISLLHVLGVVWMGPGLIAALSFGLAMIVSEILLLRFAPVEWNEHLPSWLPASLRPARLQGPMHFETSVDWSDRDEDGREFGAEFDEDETGPLDESEFESEKISATFHGLTDEGLPYLQGWQRYEMIAGQKSISLTIGFSPPFLSPPECELDHEGDEEIKLEIEHITPAGVRVNLKRRNASSVSSGKMLWHCSSATESSPL